MKNRAVIIAVAVLMVVMSHGVTLHAFTDQITTERILSENKHFIHFMDLCVTNFAEDKKELFQQAYNDHFNAEVAFLQSDYKRAYLRIRSSQEKLVQLYAHVLNAVYLEDSKGILDSLAPGVIRSKDSKARLYLTLGYRDREVGWTQYTIGDATNPKLFSYKIYKYEEGIKMARRAKRYGFLALFESQAPEVKRKIYEELMKTEAEEKDSIFFGRFIGKDDQAYIDEMARQYDDYEKSIEEELKQESAGTASAEEGEEEKKVNPLALEKRVARRVRFRNEKRVAEFLINHDFNQADDIIRKYIDDFNFKLIIATFKVKQESAGGAEGEGEKKGIAYDTYRNHLMDTYRRYTKDSALDDILKNVKVEDDISDDTQGEEEEKDASENESSAENSESTDETASQ